SRLTKARDRRSRGSACARAEDRGEHHILRRNPDVIFQPTSLALNNDDLDFGWDGPTAGAGQNNAAPAAKPTNNAPTEKRLAFAKRLMEERPGTKPPAGWDTDWRVCAAFINEMLKTPAQKIANGRDMKPTPKRLAFAEQLLSERPGTKEP